MGNTALKARFDGNFIGVVLVLNLRLYCENVDITIATDKNTSGEISIGFKKLIKAANIRGTNIENINNRINMSLEYCRMPNEAKARPVSIIKGIIIQKGELIV